MLKLHGGIIRVEQRAWESFVVTEDDYIDYLPPLLDLAAAVPVALAAHLRRSHFLFLGYGMRDWNLRNCSSTGSAGGPTVNYRSWAVWRRLHPQSGRSGVRATSSCRRPTSRSTWWLPARVAGGSRTAWGRR